MSKSRYIESPGHYSESKLLIIITESRRSREGRGGGGRVVQWCWVNFQCRGVLLIWIIVGQWPIALAVGAGVFFFFFFF